MPHDQIKASSWVILFGGAGRQNVISEMIQYGLSVGKVIVPQRKSQKLEEATAFIKNLGLDIVEVTKKNLEECLAPFSADPLLSLGFPLLFPKEFMKNIP